MFAIDPLDWGSYAGRYEMNLLDAGWGFGFDYAMRALAKGAIGMLSAVCVDVGQLYGGSKKKKDREKRHEQNAHRRNPCPQFTGSSHRY
jgi:hypothetical protein